MGLSDLDFIRIQNMVQSIVDQRITDNITETFKLQPLDDHSGGGERSLSPLRNKTKSPPATLKDYINRYVEKKLNIAQNEV